MASNPVCLFSIAALCGFCAIVSADPAAKSEPTAGTGPGSAAGAGSPGSPGDAAGGGTGSGSAGDPTIAPHDPDASPKKVEDAKQVAKKAELTPIIPSPNNPTQPAFQLYAEIDPPILATGAVFALARLTVNKPATCAPLCTDSVNSLDNLTKGYYSSTWSTASDLELYGLGAAAAVLLVSDEGVLDTLNDAVVVGEATLSANALASVMTLAAGRPRPFLYSASTPLSVRNSADAGLSFLSSHSAEAFAITTSVWQAERRLHPGSMRPKIVLGVGLGISTLIAVSRVMAGYHWITDVTGGAVVGASLGVLISAVHTSPVHIVPVVTPAANGNGVGGAGLGLSGRF